RDGGHGRGRHRGQPHGRDARRRAHGHDGGARGDHGRARGDHGGAHGHDGGAERGRLVGGVHRDGGGAVGPGGGRAQRGHEHAAGHDESEQLGGGEAGAG